MAFLTQGRLGVRVPLKEPYDSLERNFSVPSFGALHGAFLRSPTGLFKGALRFPVCGFGVPFRVYIGQV